MTYTCKNILTSFEPWNVLEHHHFSEILSYVKFEQPIYYSQDYSEMICNTLGLVLDWSSFDSGRNWELGCTSALGCDRKSQENWPLAIFLFLAES